MVDGADEFDKNLNMIKGGGGALPGKIIANHSNHMIVITDRLKRSTALGIFHYSELVKFGCNLTWNQRDLLELGLMNLKRASGKQTMSFM